MVGEFALSPSLSMREKMGKLTATSAIRSEAFTLLIWKVVS